MRCFWCDGDRFEGITDAGEQLPLTDPIWDSQEPKDWACSWCGHLVSEPNPRGGDPEETIESVKDERDDIRAQLEQCLADRLVAQADRVVDNSIESNT